MGILNGDWARESTCLGLGGLRKDRKHPTTRELKNLTVVCFDMRGDDIEQFIDNIDLGIGAELLEQWRGPPNVDDQNCGCDFEGFAARHITRQHRVPGVLSEVDI